MVRHDELALLVDDPESDYYMPNDAAKQSVSDLGFATDVAIDGRSRAVDPGGQLVDIKSVHPVVSHEADRRV